MGCRKKRLLPKTTNEFRKKILKGQKYRARNGDGRRDVEAGEKGCMN